MNTLVGLCSNSPYFHIKRLCLPAPTLSEATAALFELTRYRRKISSITYLMILLNLLNKRSMREGGLGRGGVIP